MYAFQRDAEPFWDGEAGVELLGGVRWADCGDVALGPMWSPERYHNAVVDKLQPLMEAGLFPVTLGGDHSIGYPVLKALYQARGGKPFHLVQFDTHMDYWDEEGGQRFSHASPIIRSHEAGLLAGLTQYGIRSLHTRRRQHRPGQEPRGAHLLVPAGQGHAASTTSSSTCPRAATSTSPSTSTPSTRRSRPAPARPSPAASATTRPRTSCSPSAPAATWSAWTSSRWRRSTTARASSRRCTAPGSILDTVGAVFRRRAACSADGPAGRLGARPGGLGRPATAPAVPPQRARGSSTSGGDAQGRRTVPSSWETRRSGARPVDARPVRGAPAACAGHPSAAGRDGRRWQPAGPGTSGRHGTRGRADVSARRVRVHGASRSIRQRVAKRGAVRDTAARRAPARASRIAGGAATPRRGADRTAGLDRATDADAESVDRRREASVGTRGASSRAGSACRARLVTRGHQAWPPAGVPRDVRHLEREAPAGRVTDRTSRTARVPGDVRTRLARLRGRLWRRRPDVADRGTRARSGAVSWPPRTMSTSDRPHVASAA